MGSLSEKVTSELKFKGWEDSIRDETKGGHWKLGGQEGKRPEDEASHSMNRTRLPWLRKGRTRRYDQMCAGESIQINYVFFVVMS